MSFASSIIFIILTYVNDFSLFDIIDLLLACIFALEYLIQLYVATHRFQWIKSYNSLLDLVIIIPILLFVPAERGGTNTMFSRISVASSRLLRIIKYVKAE